MSSWLDVFKRESFTKEPFVAAYEALFQHTPHHSTPIEDLLFTVLDTETTGLNTKTDEIVSYGALQVKGFRIFVNSVREYYLKPSKQNTEAIKVHGIIKNEGFTAPQEFVERFLAEIGATVLVAHHAGFDKAMLEKTAKPFGL